MVLIGAQGRVGLRLRRAWTLDGVEPPLCVSHARGPGIDAVLPGCGSAPPLPPAEGRAALILSGRTPLTAGDLDDNIAFARRGIEAARAWRCAHVFVVSSSSVYGPTGPDPVGEEAPCAATGAYARAKIALERETRAADVTALRLANVAGASQPFDNLSIGGRPALHRFADGRGPSRSFVGPATLARILWSLADRVEEGTVPPPVLNVAAPPPIEMAEIFAAFGVEPLWEPAPPGAIQHVHLDVGWLEALTGPIPPATAGALLDEARATEIPG